MHIQCMPMLPNLASIGPREVNRRPDGIQTNYFPPRYAASQAGSGTGAMDR